MSVNLDVAAVYSHSRERDAAETAPLIPNGTNLVDKAIS